MKRWLVLVLPLTMGLVLPMSALAEDDLDWLDGDSGGEEQEEEEEEEESEDEESEDEESEDDDFDEDEKEEEEEEEEDKEEKKADISISTDEPGENAKYVAAGMMHPFLGIGYSIPVLDLTGDGVGFNNAGENTKGDVAGGLPIWFGMDYFVIDNLFVGLKFRITPLFASSSEDAKSRVFDLQAQVGYHFIPELRAYLGLGFSRVTTRIVSADGFTHAPQYNAFSMGIGLSYTFFLTTIGTGALGLEAGAEYAMLIGPDFVSNPRAGVKGTSADNLFQYPLIFVGLRYAFGL